MTNIDKIKFVAQIAGDRVVDDEGNVISAGRLGGGPRPQPVLHEHDPANPTWLDFGRFAAWRRSKCTPRDYSAEGDKLADLAHSSMCLAGELAEVAEVIQGVANCEDPAEMRARLIEEVGDAIFSLSWMGDAWQANPLLLDGIVAHLLGLRVPGKPKLADVAPFCMRALIHGGLLVNAATKLIYHRKHQDAMLRAKEMIAVLECLCLILVVADVQIPEVLQKCVEKMDARYPGRTAVGNPLAIGS